MRETDRRADKSFSPRGAGKGPPAGTSLQWTTICGCSCQSSHWSSFQYGYREHCELANKQEEEKKQLIAYRVVEENRGENEISLDRCSANLVRVNFYTDSHIR